MLFPEYMPAIEFIERDGIAEVVLLRNEVPHFKRQKLLTRVAKHLQHPGIYLHVFASLVGDGDAVGSLLHNHAVLLHALPVFEGFPLHVFGALFQFLKEPRIFIAHGELGGQSRK